MVQVIIENAVSHLTNADTLAIIKHDLKHVAGWTKGETSPRPPVVCGGFFSLGKSQIEDDGQRAGPGGEVAVEIRKLRYDLLDRLAGGKAAMPRPDWKRKG